MFFNIGVLKTFEMDSLFNKVEDFRLATLLKRVSNTVVFL